MRIEKKVVGECFVEGVVVNVIGLNGYNINKGSYKFKR